jgi:iron complex transport system ATP-binding protein
MLEAKSISYSVGKAQLLHPTDLSFKPGRFHVIMGPNGAGKTTLLQLLAGELQPKEGNIFLDDKPLAGYDRMELARRRAVLSQHYELQFPICVRDVVRLGRYPHEGIMPKLSEEKLIDDCLALMHLSEFASRDYGTLSGGEAQKTQMSRVLAQLGGAGAEGKILFLDEPVSHLDMRYQHLLLQAAKDLTIRGNTVVAVLHDINLALRYADRLLFLQHGVLRYDLNELRSITSKIIDEIFDVKSQLIRTEDDRPVVVF